MDELILLKYKYKFNINFIYYLRKVEIESCIKLIYNDIILFLETKIINKFNNNHNYYLFIGMYYNFNITPISDYNYKLAKKYYLVSIAGGNSFAMYLLGEYYQFKKNYDLMIKYYLMAFENGNKKGLINIAKHYQCININYDLMKKYYLISLNKGQTYSACRLGEHYQFVEKNYDLMKKYYLIALENSHIVAIERLIEHYTYNEINYNLVKKYILLLIKPKYKIINLLYYKSNIYSLYKNYDYKYF